ncbi:unnamed protein product [Boreogadus saida]
MLTYSPAQLFGLFGLPPIIHLSHQTTWNLTSSPLHPQELPPWICFVPAQTLHPIHLVTCSLRHTPTKSSGLSCYRTFQHCRQAAAHQAVSNLLKPRTSTLSTSTPDLCNSFLQFFADKITAINHSLFPVHNTPAHSMAPPLPSLWTFQHLLPIAVPPTLAWLPLLHSPN